MGSMNKVILIGRLGRNPENRVTTSGTPVANFSLATSHFRGGNGQREELTEWHRIVAFGKMADHCTQYLRKGRLVCIEGSIHTRTWEKPAGERHYSTEVVAARVAFLDTRGDSSAEAQASSPDDGAGQEF